MRFNTALFGFLFAAMCSMALAQTPSPSPIVPPHAQELTVDAPLVPGAVPVAEPAAPPQWAQDLIVSAEKFPVVGPYVTKALVYAGIVSSILTALVAFLLTTLSALASVFSLGGLAEAAAAIQTFKNGKFMYYLQYLSMFNAKKPSKVVETVDMASMKNAS